jgi:hypothetical protein
MNFAFFRIIIVGVACCLSAQAEAARLSQFIFGTVFGSATGVDGYKCKADTANSIFQRNLPGGITPAPRALLTLGRTVSSNPTTGTATQAITGPVVLTFSSTTAGTLTYNVKESPAGLTSGTLPFTDYAESWDQRNVQLIVHFDIHFDKCVLPVTAFYKSLHT